MDTFAWFDYSNSQTLAQNSNINKSFIVWTDLFPIVIEIETGQTPNSYRRQWRQSS